ncbi:hypothetical protein M8J76_002414 [Diaphorina citri]|nr:hypothetical protein M8J76_002414 [Diaphorina citri]KAI5743586.1 hypothetical protein M8J77_019885 [Diaphorina citri]
MASQKKNLSKHVLQMKFMKRTKESEDLKRFEDEGRAFFQDAAKSTLDPDGKEANIIIQHNWYLTENLMLGRYSFNGMNPKIEEIMKSYCDFDSDEDKGCEEEMDVDVSAKQFARNIKKNILKKKNVREYLDQQNDLYNSDSTLIQTIASKFSKGKRKKNGEELTEGQSSKKMKFLKPEQE